MSSRRFQAELATLRIPAPPRHISDRVVRRPNLQSGETDTRLGHFRQPIARNIDATAIIENRVVPAVLKPQLTTRCGTTRLARGGKRPLGQVEYLILDVRYKKV